MKMEHTHVAPHAGRLISLNAVLNEQVTAHRVIAEIAAEPNAAAAKDVCSPSGPA
jgi:hypothetical protein